MKMKRSTLTLRNRLFAAVLLQPSRSYASSSGSNNSNNSNSSVPINKLQFAYARSSGPGGQNVNKLNTKVDLRFKISEAEWLDEEVKIKLNKDQANKINKSGELCLQTQTHRTQEANKKEAIEKLNEYIELAKQKKKERIPTQVPQWAKEQRIQEKKRRSELKKSRNVNRRDD